MKKCNYLLFCLVIFLFFSCETVDNIKNAESNDSIEVEEELVDGKWTDQVGLSQDSVMFNSEEDSIVIATKYITWWLRSFTFYETSDISSKKSYYTCTLEEREKSRTVGVEVKYEWLTVYASSQEKVVKIKVDKNNTGKTRYWSITLQGGDYFGRIYCQQPSM